MLPLILHVVDEMKPQYDMLAFAADHHVAPTIEKFGFSEKGFGQALEKLKLGNLRYRGVLVAA